MIHLGVLSHALRDLSELRVCHEAHQSGLILIHSSTSHASHSSHAHATHTCTRLSSHVVVTEVGVVVLALARSTSETSSDLVEVDTLHEERAGEISVAPCKL